MHARAAGVDRRGRPAEVHVDRRCAEPPHAQRAAGNHPRASLAGAALHAVGVGDALLERLALPRHGRAARREGLAREHVFYEGEPEPRGVSGAVCAVRGRVGAAAGLRYRPSLEGTGLPSVRPLLPVSTPCSVASASPAPWLKPSEHLVRLYEHSISLRCPLLQKWLEYRMNTAPTASQCAKMHRYQEEKYNVKVLALEWRRALDKESPPQERIRRYAEYSDQKWDMRRSRAIYNQMQSQQWLIQRENQPDIQDRFWYSRYRDWWETWNFIKLDLLRPPVKQNLWKIEDDARALRHLDAIENADYKLNPWETTRKERYMLTPSHVAGAEVPRSVTHIKKRFDISKLPAVPLGDLAMRISPENPIYGFADDKEYEKWFAEQRKLLISARSELEQMKRDGYRPAEIGGDLDPYVASRPQDSWKLARKKRIDLLDKARAERTALENRKRDARERLLGSMESQQTLQEQAAFRPFVETAVYTKDFGKIEANRTRRQYIDGTHGRVLRPTASVIDDDDTELVSEPNDAVRTVFGGKGAALFSTSTAMTKDKASRPDAARPDARTLEQAAQEHQEALAKQRQEEEEKAERKKDSL
eukprot:TRINITY_DN5857_c0_g1_i2.p1 TRINITY_DN5857_c0_g1~~TRINITY_DN5857_c0_g1_i2.p1  ORF type:complete len:589 (+),score=95.40 TRINITY_DN5857_c0_g1_i2:99-1865(+)